MAEPYTDNPQVAAQVRQLLAERENAEAYGQTSTVERVDKTLKDLGWRPDKKAKAEKVEDNGPTGRGPGRPRKTTAG